MQPTMFVVFDAFPAFVLCASAVLAALALAVLAVVAVRVELRRSRPRPSPLAFLLPILTAMLPMLAAELGRALGVPPGPPDVEPPDDSAAAERQDAYDQGRADEQHGRPVQTLWRTIAIRDAYYRGRADETARRG